MTLKDLYETIKQKIERAENHLERTYKKRVYMQREKSIISYEYEEVVKQESELKGEINAYTDILCLIESSGVLNNDR